MFFFFFNDTATTEIYTLSLHDALPIYRRLGLHVRHRGEDGLAVQDVQRSPRLCRSEEHTSELQSLAYLVCRLLLEKKKINADTGGLSDVRSTEYLPRRPCTCASLRTHH